MKKKALACLLAAVMALSLAACGSGSDNKKTSEKQNHRTQILH